MRAMKKTSLAFGPLVNIPIRMYKATESHDLGFHQHHGPTCLGSVKMVRTCADCGAVVEYGDIVKGIERGGKLVVLSDGDLESLEVEQGTNIEIVQFCQADEVDPLLWEAPYYLEPDNSVEGYSLLRAALVETDRVGIVRFVMRTKQTLGVLRVLGNVLVIHTMCWIDEVRSAQGLKGLDKEVVPEPRAMQVAKLLIDSMTSEFTPENFHDDYTKRLNELIDAKAAGAEFVELEHVEATDDTSDLLAKLEASIAATKKPPAKKAPAKRVTTRRKTA